MCENTTTQSSLYYGLIYVTVVISSEALTAGKTKPNWKTAEMFTKSYIIRVRFIHFQCLGFFPHQRRSCWNSGAINCICLWPRWRYTQLRKWRIVSKLKQKGTTLTLSYCLFHPFVKQYNTTAFLKTLISL